MKVITGTVESGRIEIPIGALAEGSWVAIFAPEPGPVTLSAAEEAELEAAMDDIHQGNFIDGAELLRQLREAE